MKVLKSYLRSRFFLQHVKLSNKIFPEIHVSILKWGGLKYSKRGSSVMTYKYRREVGRDGLVVFFVWLLLFQHFALVG
jgi:hypothetical protein